MSGHGGKHYAEKYTNRRSDYNMRSDHACDLANLATYDGYLDAMSEVFQRCFRLLHPGRYMAIIVRNAYQHAEYMFTHVDLARRASSVGFIPKGEIIWYQAGTKLRPYGYPYSYVPNIAHQNIVILQRSPTTFTCSLMCERAWAGSVGLPSPAFSHPTSSRTGRCQPLGCLRGCQCNSRKKL